MIKGFKKFPENMRLTYIERVTYTADLFKDSDVPYVQVRLCYQPKRGRRKGPLYTECIQTVAPNISEAERQRAKENLAKIILEMFFESCKPTTSAV